MARAKSKTFAQRKAEAIAFCEGCRHLQGAIKESLCSHHGKAYQAVTMERSTFGNCGPTGKFKRAA